MAFALITGASKGIGRAIARELASRHIPLILVARTESLLQALQAELQAQYQVAVHVFAADLSDPESARHLVSWIQEAQLPVQILVNNAGYGLGGSFESRPAEAQLEMMRLNMLTPVLLTRLLLPELRKQPRAYILNIASTAAYQAVPGLTVYGATKAFLLNFSRGLRYELRKTTVSVTAVSPGGTATEFANRADLGSKAVKTGEKLNMQPEQVAREAVNALFAGKAEFIPGWLNKISTWLVWLFPKAMAERAAAGIYEIP
ncbi:MAG TPA: SDR family oxidoreductase [Sediminibacterium sp.]|nr:SDR family oxidoreductase [Sediminibacterium sp.]